MADKRNMHGLIIPGDGPLSQAALKRQLLFFDSVSVIDPKDRALVNAGEITETFPNMTVRWEDYAAYPRTENFLEEYSYLLGDTKILQRKGILRILAPLQKNPDEAGVNFMLYNSAISEPEFIVNAIPDLSQNKPNVIIPNGMICGGGMAQSGFHSKYELKVNNPYKLSGIDYAWQALAYLRVGRALKYMRRAYTENCFPIACDTVNHNISKVFLSDRTGTIGAHSLQEFTNYSISLEVVDAWELEQALNEMSWDDVLKIRREILPKIATFRDYVISKANVLGKSQPDSADEAKKLIIDLKGEFEQKKENLATEWEKLRIASLTKGGGATGGLSLVTSFSAAWEENLFNVISLGLVAVSSLTPELKSLIPARRKVRKHPLYFTTLFPLKPT